MLKSQEFFRDKKPEWDKMGTENTHWRQLCPSIFEIEAADVISIMYCTSLTLSLAYVPGPKSCHRRSVKGEASKECEIERKGWTGHVASFFSVTK